MLIILAALVAWGAIAAIQHSAAIASMVRRDGAAKDTLRRYPDALCAGDVKTASALNDPAMSAEVFASLCKQMPQFKGVTKITFSKVNYFEDPHSNHDVRSMYYIECFAHFEKGGTELV